MPFILLQKPRNRIFKCNLINKREALRASSTMMQLQHSAAGWGRDSIESILIQHKALAKMGNLYELSSLEQLNV